MNGIRRLPQASAGSLGRRRQPRYDGPHETCALRPRHCHAASSTSSGRRGRPLDPIRERRRPGAGRHIVLVSGDEEYRSEEALPQLGKILAQHHGFTCTVLFAIDPETGAIDPDNRRNIPGLAALEDADLMIIATRFRDLPDEQMAHIDRYLRAGKPVFGIRTATHAFNIESSPTYARYTWNGRSPATSRASVARSSARPGSRTTASTGARARVA